jgi:O-antigen/teichoic acid export membrane protein
LAVTAAAVARSLGASNFGVYAGGTAAYNLAVSFTDLGFGVAAVREIGKHPDQEGPLLRAAVHVQFIWSAGIMLLLLAAALVTGGQRGAVMLVLCPAVLMSGLSAARQIFAARYQARAQLLIDLSVTVLQAVAMISLAVLGAGVVPLAAALSVSVCLNSLLIARLARRLIAGSRAMIVERWRMLRMAIPLGIASLLASLYFTIDQVILSLIVSSRELGQYAAAVRLLTMLVMIPGFVMAAGIPGLARMTGDRAQLSRFTGTLAHWISVTALPICVALAVFAQPAIHIVFGAAFAQSVGLLRILMVAGALSLVSNVLGIVLLSLNIVRGMILVNIASLAINVAGNFLLVPRYGVAASAWLTAVCEAIVISYAVFALHTQVSFRLILERVWRPMLATAAAALAGIVLGADSAVAIGVSLGVFAIAVPLLGAWPADLVPARFGGPGTRT